MSPLLSYLNKNVLEMIKCNLGTCLLNSSFGSTNFLSRHQVGSTLEGTSSGFLGRAAVVHVPTVDLQDPGGEWTSRILSRDLNYGGFFEGWFIPDFFETNSAWRRSSPSYSTAQVSRGLWHFLSISTSSRRAEFQQNCVHSHSFKKIFLRGAGRISDADSGSGLSARFPAHP